MARESGRHAIDGHGPRSDEYVKLRRLKLGKNDSQKTIRDREPEEYHLSACSTGNPSSSSNDHDPILEDVGTMMPLS